MYSLSIITVAYKNHPGIVKTYKSLAILEKYINTQYPHLTFEWIVIDGDSFDGTKDFLISLDLKYNVRYLSEPDKGIYDAMNKGIKLASGKFCLFLNSGDLLEHGIGEFVRQLSTRDQNDKNIYIGNAVLDFGNGKNKLRMAKKSFYIYHSLPASHQATFFPTIYLKDNLYDLNYKVSGDYALVASLYKQGHKIIKINETVAQFSMGGVSTLNSEQLCIDARKVQENILKLPKAIVFFSNLLRKITTGSSKKRFLD